MSRKRDTGHDGIQEEILRKLEDSSIQRQIDIGGGVVVNITQEDYGKDETKFYWDLGQSYHYYMACFPWIMNWGWLLANEVPLWNS